MAGKKRTGQETPSAEQNSLRKAGCTCVCPCHSDPEHARLYHSFKEENSGASPAACVSCGAGYPTDLHHSCPVHGLGEVRGQRDRWR